MAKSRKSQSAPSKLAKTGKTSGVEVNETELEQVSGGSTVAGAPTTGVVDGSVMKWSTPIAPVYNAGFK